MEFEKLFSAIFICLLSKSTLSAYVSDLKTNVDCKTLLAKKVAERSKDPTLMNKITITNETDYKTATSIYEFTVKDTYHMDVPLSHYCRGFVTLIVNIASSCALTAQNYAQLTKINKDFDSKIRILIFPCNQFMNQMPEADGDEMLCHFKKRNASPGAIFAKVDVNGDNAIPLYKYLKEQTPGARNADVEWNFTKFLVDKNGKVVKRFSSTVEPNGIVNDIKKLM